MLARRGPVDVETLRAYCQMWARWREAENGIDAAGQLTRTGGRMVASPLIRIANQSAAQVRMLEDRLGLSVAVTESGDVVDRRTLAGIFGVHMMTVTKWERDGMPILERGRRGKPSQYSRSAVATWREGRANVGETVDAVRERARKDRAQAILAEQAHAIRNRDLVSVVEVEKVWAGIVAAVRTRLLALPATLSDRLYRVSTLEGVAGVERELDLSMREVLRELAEPGPPAPLPEAA